MQRDSRIVAIISGLAIIAVALVILIPNLMRARISAYHVPPPSYQDVRAQPGKYKMQPSGTGTPDGPVGRDRDESAQETDRKIIREAYLQLLVEDVSKAADQIQAVAQKFGGYVESTEISQSKGSTASGRITIRVPASRLDEARSELKRLARLAEVDKTEARDVTKEFVDNEARLRNYQAEERQYLEIMRRATKVEDTLKTAERLSDVRGRIEQLQAELKYLSQQVEMASVAVALRVESVAQASEWRPWYQTKLAFADMVEGLANFADFAVYFLLMLPVILLWTLAVVFSFVVGVKIFVWLRRKFWPGLTRTLKTSEPAKN